MEKLKASLKDKKILWLFLIAAFVVVIILLSLLFSHDSGTKDIKADTPELTNDPIVINPETIDFSDIEIGKTENRDVTVTANTSIQITKIDKPDTNGLNIEDTCTTFDEIKQGVSCTITISYNPTEFTAKKTVPINIVWHNTNYSIDKKNQIIVTISTASKNTPIEPTEIEEDEIIIADDEEIEIPDISDTKKSIIDDIEEIAPAIDKRLTTPKQSIIPEVSIPSEACSDFAFAGYDLSGSQIGWIKPEFGTYKFYPFSDKNCENPTGIYNPDTGIITDIDDKSKKIGTDVEHIGLKHTQATSQVPQLQSMPDKKTRTKIKAPETPKDFANPEPKNQVKKQDVKSEVYIGTGAPVISSVPYDRSFLLRQFKPIPATIVSEIRADKEALETGLPVRATVDRNVYSDNGRTVILPAGTLMMGYVTGNLPGPYTTVGRMDIRWYQFIRPDGVEFNFKEGDGIAPFSADAQGRSGVPGYGSTDYVEQFVMPMLTAVVPAAVNMIAPVTDAFVNQIDLDNNTVVQSGTVRSSELAKNEIINTWNKIAQKLMVDMMDDTTPPFSIAAGTRITVFSPQDLLVTCGDPKEPENEGKKCAIIKPSEDKREYQKSSTSIDPQDSSWVGQVRSFNLEKYCDGNGKVSVDTAELQKDGYDYRTVLAYCQSIQYQAKNNAKQEAVYANQQDASNKNSIASKGEKGTQDYNTQVLGLKYNEDGSIENPFQKKEEVPAATAVEEVITCEDGNAPDSNGCCAGETYTDMGEDGFNCCPDAGGDCFPPIQ